MAPLTLSELSPPVVIWRFPPTLEFPNLSALLLAIVALPFSVVFRLTEPAAVRMPTPEIAALELTVKDPVVVTSTPKSAPPFPALMVRFPNPEEAAVVKLTALSELVAFKVKGIEEEDTPAIVIVPFELLPIVRLAPLIKPSSVSDKEKSPIPEPSPIVLADLAAKKVVPAVPELIELPEFKATSLAVIDKGLFEVFSVWPEAKLKSPPIFVSASVSESKVVVPWVVTPDESTIPLLAFAVRPLKLELPVLKVMDRPVELVAFKVTFSMVVVTPSTVISPLLLSPTIRLPAVIFENPGEFKLNP